MYHDILMVFSCESSMQPVHGHTDIRLAIYVCIADPKF